MKTRTNTNKARPEKAPVKVATSAALIEQRHFTECGKVWKKCGNGCAGQNRRLLAVVVESKAPSTRTDTAGYVVRVASVVRPFEPLNNGTGRMPVEVPKMEHEDMTTEDEVKISTPYSDRATWAKVLMGQQLTGRGNLRGPPGLREKVQSLLAPFTERERADLYFDRDKQDAMVKAVLAEV